MATKKIQILESLIKHAENADTLGGRSPSYFAPASEVDELQALVGDTSVATQINTVVNELTADDFGVYVQDTEPTEAVEGDIWIDSSVDSSDYVTVNHVHNDATTTTSGFMSAIDKAKLDNLTEVQEIAVDDALSSISINPVQNKVINAALENKSNSDHNHTEYALASDVIDLQSKVGDTPVQDQINNALSIFDGDSDIYIQNEEPVDAPDGALWVDLDEDGTIDTENSVVNIDTTLTVEGYAADAKATGHAISGIHDTITDIEDEIDGINNTIVGINSSIDNINNAIIGIDEAVDSINGTVTNISNTMTETNNVVAGITNTVNELSSEIDGLDTNIKNLNNIVNQVSSKVGNTSVSDQIATAINSLREEILGGAW